MSSVLSDAYTEVSCVLDVLDPKYKEKIPKQVLDAIYNNKNNNHKFYIDVGMNIDDIQISRQALIIISILNLKYWEEDVEKQKKLKDCYYKNGESSRKSAKELAKTDFIEGASQVDASEKVEELSIEVKGKKSIWDNIKNAINNIFNKLTRR